MSQQPLKSEDLGLTDNIHTNNNISNWREGEPNNYENRNYCVQHKKCMKILWNYEHCDSQFRYVCEKKDLMEGEPNNYENLNHCVQHIKCMEELWNDEHCDSQFRYVCVKDSREGEQSYDENLNHCVQHIKCMEELWNDEHCDSQFQYVCNKDWRLGESINVDCVQLIKCMENLWNDERCNSHFRYVCDKEQTTYPTPSISTEASKTKFKTIEPTAITPEPTTTTLGPTNRTTTETAQITTTKPSEVTITEPETRKIITTKIITTAIESATSNTDIERTRYTTATTTTTISSNATTDVTSQTYVLPQNVTKNQTNWMNSTLYMYTTVLTNCNLLSDVHTVALDVVTYLLTSLSIICLLLTILTYVYLRNWRIKKNIIHMNLAASLGTAQLLFLTLTDLTENKNWCSFIAVIIQYFFTVSFAWMMLEGVYLLITSHSKLHHKNPRTAVYIAFGWFAPFCYVVVPFSVSSSDYGTKDACWLNCTSGVIWVFVVPILITIMFNSCVLAVIIRVFLGFKGNENKTKRQQLRSSIRAVLLMLPLLGLTWIFGLMASYNDRNFFAYLFAICNSLQGIYIFVQLIILNNEINQAFLQRYKRYSSRTDVIPLTTTSHSTTRQAFVE